MLIFELCIHPTFRAAEAHYQENMSGSLTLPLRPLSRRKKQQTPTDANAPDYDQHDLALQIAQINAQRGSFRNVTEAALKEEIEQAKTRRRQGKGKEKDEENTGEKDESSGSKDAAAIGASDDRTEELYNGRNEVLAFAIAPLGSIALDHTQEPPDPAEDSAAQLKVEDTRTVARGWKSANFSAASKKLSRAAERLGKETEDEDAFWAEIMRIKESGWTVMRAPRERNVLSVRCSSMQAGKDFRDRGLIKLRRGADGKVVLDQGLDASGPRGLRVRVERNGKVVGKSNPMWLERLRVATSKGEKIDVDERLKIKRDTLFEEELWYELGRETRALLGYNATLGPMIKQKLLSWTWLDLRIWRNQKTYDLSKKTQWT
ncbi:RNA polymerase II mediator complex subunit [Ascosphaera atra]|nr:RNA polymerase II mediator complex subunit [Ascosphaera atra]